MRRNTQCIEGFQGIGKIHRGLWWQLFPRSLLSVKCSRQGVAEPARYGRVEGLGRCPHVLQGFAGQNRSRNADIQSRYLQIGCRAFHLYRNEPCQPWTNRCLPDLYLGRSDQWCCRITQNICRLTERHCRPHVDVLSRRRKCAMRTGRYINI